MTDYGIDVSAYPDLDRRFRPITGTRALAEAALRRVLTRKGTLSITTLGGVVLGDPDYGAMPTLSDLLNARVNGMQLPAYAGQYETEIKRDERVEDSLVSLTMSGSAIVAVIQVTPVEGTTFSMTITVDQLAAKLAVVWPTG